MNSYLRIQAGNCFRFLGNRYSTHFAKCCALDLIPFILGKESAKREKPFPDIFLNAAEKLGHAPTECFVLEDALKGLNAAKNAGMPCVIIKNDLNQILISMCRNSFPQPDRFCFCVVELRLFWGNANYFQFFSKSLKNILNRRDEFFF
ncbi:MAG: hypothetical protein Ct9H300mP23_02560 [Nitrospinota bacterium]|nr:MAG: hypothetical protein Ct9H300mP23_02560 [Nitrospinota bacterium]